MMTDTQIRLETDQSSAQLVAPTSAQALAHELNNHMKRQPKESPLTIHDRCDRCGETSQAKSRFILQHSKGVLMFCGNHTRTHLRGIFEHGVEGYWLDPSILFNFPGVEAPKEDHSRSGDGLTDA